MRFYESIFVVHPAIEDNALDRVVDESIQLFEKRGVEEILYKEIMGKKRLAYPIEKQRFGTYVLIQFRSDGAGNGQLNRDLELKDNILAHLIVRIEENEVREEKAEPESESVETAEDQVEATVPEDKPVDDEVAEEPAEEAEPVEAEGEEPQVVEANDPQPEEAE